MNTLKKITAYIKIIRPLNVLITFFVVIVAVLISQRTPTNIFTIFFASLSAAIVAAAGNIVNDIHDIETDKIAHPNRVLALGAITKKEAWIEYFLLLFISIIITSFLSKILLVVVILTNFLLYVYSFHIKKITFAGNLIIAFITGLAFIYGGLVANNITAAVIPAVFAFMINFIREIVKDIEDIEGDSQEAVVSIPIKYGVTAAKKIIFISAIILIGLTFYPFIFKIYKIEYFLIVMIFVNPMLILSLKMLFQTKENNLKKVSDLLKLIMVLGLFSIYFGN